MACECDLCMVERREAVAVPREPQRRRRGERTCDHCDTNATLPGHRYCAGCERELGHG